MSIQLAYRFVKNPREIIEDVLVKIDKFIFPIGFVIVDMEGDIEIPLILGRSFFATMKTNINVSNGELVLRVRDEDVTFKIPNVAKRVFQKNGTYNIFFSIDQVVPNCM